MDYPQSTVSKIENSVFSGNTMSVSNIEGYGAAVFNEGKIGSISDTVFENNVGISDSSHGFFGGAICNDEGGYS